jgi:hypothetical protein
MERTGTLNLLAIQPSITTNTYGLRIGWFDISMPSLQILLGILFSILYFNGWYFK